jgi:DNA-binding response OmpR family regulator
MDMALKKILVVDDDPAIRDLLGRFFSRQNFQIESAENGETALELFEKFNPDLIILDVMLPDIRGFDVCQQIKKIRTNVLVILLTSLTDVEHQVTGLQWADAYVTKPFHLPVLEKQVQALFRMLHSLTSTQPQSLVFEKLVIDPVSREVILDNQNVFLTPLEFDLLYCLAKHPKRVWRREELLQEVWGHEFFGEMRLVDVHVGQLRKKIEPNPNQPTFIQTIRGVGYKFTY